MLYTPDHVLRYFFFQVHTFSSKCTRLHADQQDDVGSHAFCTDFPPRTLGHPGGPYVPRITCRHRILSKNYVPPPYRISLGAPARLSYLLILFKRTLILFKRTATISLLHPLLRPSDVNA